MKTTWKIFWGVGFVLVAVALILDALGILAGIISPFGEVSILALAAGLLLLAYAISRLFKGAVGEIFIPLSLIFMLFEKNIAFLMGREDTDIINNWLLLACAGMLWIGFSILLSGVKKKKRFKLFYKDNSHHSSGTFGSTVKYINCDGFKYESVENNLGSYTIFFENVEKYQGGGVLEIENNLGSMTINVPSTWKIDTRIESSLGGSSKPRNDSSSGPDLTIKGDNNLGGVNIKYV